VLGERGLDAIYDFHFILEKIGAERATERNSTSAAPRRLRDRGLLLD
jgi:hypothetical protein